MSSSPTIQKETIYQAIESLSPESLQDLASFIAYLQYKEQHETDWFLSLYQLFEPVRGPASQMSDDEIDQIIGDAVSKVQSERKTQGRV